ncbi:ABC transporter ATP-binding protein [Virgisporangium ochraceum]|uniref:Nitrate ABC transporter ATP-binding protein n=1 Tax=Virgisporangium ochraceum TaxID=65505 RepID=A0A8J4A397_9ACTN|nr:ABC transporter ATP-binding protein [Virgisporangium ochraceum]GIJ74013.1 nitrate ABC transporter ATP-binding protein [Virgisporangium ochraceum]
MTAFQVRGLTRRFRDTVALDDVSLDVHDGEFLVVLGPSGSGKSTLLEILAGLQRADAGEVRYRDRPVDGPRPEIGVVFQDPALYPWRTVGRNVGIGLELDGVPAADRRRRVAAQLAVVGLAGQDERYPHQLSGGMRQRAGLARALVRDPSVLLMDEPYGAVDHITRVRLQQDLLELWSRRRTTVVFVTHDVGEAVLLADRVVLLSARPGRVAREFSIDAPRPRARGDKALLAYESEVYAALREPAGTHSRQ